MTRSPNEPQGELGSPEPQGELGSPEPQGELGSPEPQGEPGSPEPQGELTPTELTAGGSAAAPGVAPRGAVHDVVETLLVAVLVVLFVTTFIVQNSVIPSPSMDPTLLVGDYVLVDRCGFAPVDGAAPAAWAGQRRIGPGDVVVFKSPREPGVDYVKRVIGLPGQTIEVRNKRVFRDGALLDEPYAVHASPIVQPGGHGPGSSTRDNLLPVVVPPDCYFVMGDNRDYSSDSREWGFVPRSHVTGRALVIFWSRRQRPGAWEARGLARLELVGHSLRTALSGTRWDRLGRIIR